jgi:hypothetical protein
LILKKLHIPDNLDEKTTFSRLEKIHEKVVDSDIFTKGLTIALFGEDEEFDEEESTWEHYKAHGH